MKGFLISLDFCPLPPFTVHSKRRLNFSSFFITLSFHPWWCLSTGTAYKSWAPFVVQIGMCNFISCENKGWNLHIRFHLLRRRNSRNLTLHQGRDAAGILLTISYGKMMAVKISQIEAIPFLVSISFMSQTSRHSGHSGHSETRIPKTLKSPTTRTIPISPIWHVLTHS